MPLKHFKYIFLYCFLIGNNVFAQQNYYSKTFTTENGLPHNHVRSIVQDDNGFLWIATWDGLSRYNGYEFRNYYHNQGDSTSIAYFQCEDVEVDFQNSVWINNVSGISKYNRHSDNFIRFDNVFVGSIMIDRDGRFWVNSNRGLLRWNYETLKFDTISIESDSKYSMNTRTYPANSKFDNENRLWIILNDPDGINHLYRFKLVGENRMTYEPIGLLNYFRNTRDLNNVSWNIDILVTSTGNIWILSDYGNFLFNRERKEFLPFSGDFPETEFSGLNKSDFLKTRSHFEVINSVMNENSNQNNITRGLLENYLIDKQNILWESVIIGGGTATGLTRKVPTTDLFTHYFTEFNPMAAINSFFPVVKDKYGTVWGGATNINLIFQAVKQVLIN